MEKTYEPKNFEDKIYKSWEKSGYFTPEKCKEDHITKKDNKRFSIVLPPPNVTGTLHMGHATMLAIQDILIRFHRMIGDETVWIPGTDHAAIATQEKVERIIYKERGLTRHDLGREEFLKLVKNFAQQSHDTIVHQMKKMGASVDWTREAYTLDKERTCAVQVAFKRMYDDGIIYRGHRIVNWDPQMQTTVSDDEIERKTNKDILYYLQFGPFIITTARPETKFGDKYIVMHPDDDRYKEYYHGQNIKLEWINGPVVATVIKDTAIDMEFGTGVMTITPWHDAVDFDIANRHNLEKEQIIDFNGKLLLIAGEFFGMDLHEARPKIVEKFEKKGLMVKKDESYIHEVAVNSRGGEPIEPQIKEQWFVNVNKEFLQKGKMVTLKSLMQEAVSSGLIEIVPKRFKKIYFNWINNLRDWCISRQIWYGHRIPVWYKEEKIFVGTEPPKDGKWEQDLDTLDTWFSSGLWTFSTLGWPKITNDMKKYHPTSVMETGYDIIFFWVARMILMSRYLLDGEIPFKSVYLHGLVRDSLGKKMSKSLGNVIDPLKMTEKYGTDAVRLSLVIGTTPGNDTKLNEEKIAGFRNFTNKIWNISRYVIGITKNSLISGDVNAKKLTLADFWILEKMSFLIKSVSDDINNLNFSQAGEKLCDFTWNDFADWYIEISKFEKSEEKNKILIVILEDLLKLWHPFMPYVTEAIWSLMPIKKHKFIMIEEWPVISKYEGIISNSHSESKNFELIKEIIKSIRSARLEGRIEPNKKVKVIINIREQKKYGNKKTEELIKSQESLIKNLRTGVDNFEIISSGEKIKNAVQRAIVGINIYIPLEGVVDFKGEALRTMREIEKLEKYVFSSKKRLANKKFTARAPKLIVEKYKENLAGAENKLKQLKNQKKHE